jgi:hypothetical protein
MANAFFITSGRWLRMAPEELQRIDLASQSEVKCVRVTLRHGKWIVGEIDFLFLFVPLEHRKVDNPAKCKFFVIDKAEFTANFLTCLRSECGKLNGNSANEKHRAAFGGHDLLLDCSRSFRTNSVCDWTRPLPTTNDHVA